MKVRVSNSGFTVAEYVQQYQEGKIVVNKDYQRSDKVWPLSAKSFLIDTILLGYPMPKLSLYQRTDLKTKKTTKEIVDGQQRSRAIREFYEGKFAIVGKGDFAGMKFDDLDEETQQSFLDYSLSVDLFLSATPQEIREMFRRINSYTIPLNAQEQRHATHQGEFKFFILKLEEVYSEALKSLGVFNEKQLARMLEAELFTDIIMGLTEGINTIRKSALDRFYSENDERFIHAEYMLKVFSGVFSVIFNMKDIHCTSLMKPYNFTSLFLAIAHKVFDIESLRSLRKSDKNRIDMEKAILNLTDLSDAISSKSKNAKYAEYINASSSSTNLKKNREARFKFIYDLIQ